MSLHRIVGASFLVGLMGLVLVLGREEGNRPVMAAAPLAGATATAEAVQGELVRELPPVVTPTASADINRLANPHTDIPTRPRIEVITYTVQAGDTPTGLAARFNLRPESILWGNPNLSADAGNLRIGQVLNILPVDGVLHYAEKGDTLERLQLLYAAPVEDIVSYPGNKFPLDGPYTLAAGQTVIVPGGRKPIVWKEPGPRVVPGKGRRSPGFYKGPLVYYGTGTFVWPVPPNVITQGFWSGHPAIDVDTYTGQPVLASDSGTVIFSGWDNTGYGNLVIVEHGNDFWTYYAHNDSNLVRVGEGVLQGQTIALSGSTGNSTGSHLDFRIRYRAAEFLNPLNFLR